MGKVRARVLATGRVQGVCFRAYTEEEANRCGVTGWVRNLPDGGVEAVFEGEEKDVAQMVAWCRKGPRHAVVTDVDVQYEEYRGDMSHFSVTFFQRG